MWNSEEEKGQGRRDKAAEKNGQEEEGKPTLLCRDFCNEAYKDLHIIMSALHKAFTVPLRMLSDFISVYNLRQMNSSCLLNLMHDLA